MAKTESSLKHSNLSYMLRDHKKKMLSSREKMFLGCDAEANAGAEVDLSELEEHDIWAAMENHLSDLDLHHHQEDHREDLEENYHRGGYGLASSLSSKATPQNIVSATEFHGRSSGKSLLRQQSAPMNVPDWSKILGSSATKSSARQSVFREDDGSDDSEDEWSREDHLPRRLPPHEVVARDYARSHSVAFSVCEGAGHTLKGRDLSRVRNAVLKQTGFL
ncbi:hypothetical protein SELMODRAFT_426737 [Selaginella moellendorffii]|uniref:Senescence regulator n=1 Tax=Selaginella moellendorffii TaxID=88036 RepID=D8SXB5_SELML|nr:uncharacterized protein LOC9656798 [Selaginella moellendorffii]EFJ10775.1 hypothetical protein SELMODRAFT_426737 [Selaginella moellendorffii]|eukprot:XP_002987983.1 uncharacterized protein LOC9656798 [Selaginella moellendorffii]